jgi:hypothetical protein
MGAGGVCNQKIWEDARKEGQGRSLENQIKSGAGKSENHWVEDSSFFQRFWRWAWRGKPVFDFPSEQIFEVRGGNNKYKIGAYT